MTRGLYSKTGTIGDYAGSSFAGCWLLSIRVITNPLALSWVTYGLDYLLWGMNPFGYHLTNLFLHAANAVLFYLFAFRLLSLSLSPSGDRAEVALHLSAALAALFFAVHPLRVESVAWVTERRDVLSALFFQLTILFYLKAKGRNQSSRTSVWWLSSALVVYGLSLLSKAVGMTLPIVLLVLNVYPLKRMGGEERGSVWASSSSGVA